MKKVFETLVRDADYALKSQNRDLVCETYGETKMARLLGAIDQDEFWALNGMLIKDGLNNPEAKLQ